MSYEITLDKEKITTLISCLEWKKEIFEDVINDGEDLTPSEASELGNINELLKKLRLLNLKWKKVSDGVLMTNIGNQDYLIMGVENEGKG